MRLQSQFVRRRENIFSPQIQCFNILLLTFIFPNVIRNSVSHGQLLTTALRGRGGAFGGRTGPGAVFLRGETWAALLVGSVSLALLAGALVFQYVWHYPPCEICHWQRWPHIASAVAGLGGGLLLARGILPSRAAPHLCLARHRRHDRRGRIGRLSRSIEWQWWEGPAACTGSVSPPAPARISRHFISCAVTSCVALSRHFPCRLQCADFIRRGGGWGPSRASRRDA